MLLLCSPTIALVRRQCEKAPRLCVNACDIAYVFLEFGERYVVMSRDFFRSAFEVEGIDGFGVGVAGGDLAGGSYLGVGCGEDWWGWTGGSLRRGCRQYRGLSTSLRFGRNDSICGRKWVEVGGEEVEDLGEDGAEVAVVAGAGDEG